MKNTAKNSSKAVLGASKKRPFPDARRSSNPFSSKAAPDRLRGRGHACFLIRLISRINRIYYPARVSANLRTSGKTSCAAGGA
jgi:hypothetical protein